jgi:phage terminase Nu1 subunit (DNA packaging protein)
VTEKLSMICDNNAVASFLGVTLMTLTNWCKSGMPKLSRGKYNLKDCFDWWLENIQEPKTQTTKAKDANERYWQAKADNEEIKRDQARGELLPVSEIYPEWCARVGEVKQGLLSLKIRLPPVLEGKTRDEMRDIIEKYTVALCNGYARNGQYTPVVIDKDGSCEAGTPEKKPAKPAKKGKKRAARR